MKVSAFPTSEADSQRNRVDSVKHSEGNRIDSKYLVPKGHRVDITQRILSKVCSEAGSLSKMISHLLEDHPELKLHHPEGDLHFHRSTTMRMITIHLSSNEDARFQHLEDDPLPLLHSLVFLEVVQVTTPKATTWVEDTPLRQDQDTALHHHPLEVHIPHHHHHIPALHLLKEPTHHPLKEPTLHPLKEPIPHHHVVLVPHHHHFLVPLLPKTTMTSVSTPTKTKKPKPSPWLQLRGIATPLA